MKKGRHSTEQYEKKIQIWKRGKKKGKIKPHYSYLICYCLAYTALRPFIINLFMIVA